MSTRSGSISSQEVLGESQPLMALRFDASAQQELRKVVRLTPDLEEIQHKLIPRLSSIECQEVGLCNHVDDGRAWFDEILTALVNFRCLETPAKVQGDKRDSPQQGYGSFARSPYPVCDVCLEHIALENRSISSQWEAKRPELPSLILRAPSAKTHRGSAEFRHDSRALEAKQPLPTEKSTKTGRRATATQK